METAILADHMVKVEPRGVYGERRLGGVDGLVDLVKHGPVEPTASGVATSAVRGRIAFDVFTCADTRRLQDRTNRKHKRHGDAVTAAGDVFIAPAFTPYGCPFPSALSLFRELAHTGDSVPLLAGRDIAKFQSEAATWITATHTNFMVHAAAAAAARSGATAIKQYCVRRLVDNYIMRAADSLPPLVPRPD